MDPRRDGGVALQEVRGGAPAGPGLPPPAIDDIVGHEEAVAAALAGLGLPRAAFAGRRVADVRGSGRVSLVCALLGARVTLVQSDERRVHWTEHLFARQRQPLRVTADLDCVRDADVVFAGDDLLSGGDALALVERVIDRAGQGVPVVCTLADRSSWRRRLLQRRVLDQIARGRADVERAANRMFGRALDADARRSGRDRSAILAERFLGPLPLLPSMEEIRAALAFRGVRVHGAAPASPAPLDAPLDPASPEGRRWFDAWADALATHGMVPASGRHPDETILAANEQLDRVERKIAERDYDDRDLRLLDAGGDADRVLLAVRRPEAAIRSV